MNAYLAGIIGGIVALCLSILILVFVEWDEKHWNRKTKKYE